MPAPGLARDDRSPSLEGTARRPLIHSNAGKPVTDQSQKSDRPPVVVPLLGLILLVFLLGSAVAQFRLFPYPQFLEPAFVALQARIERSAITAADPGQMPGQVHWRVARTAELRVTRHDPERSWSGYTLYTSAHVSAAFLVDENGEPVHEWGISFREVWPDAPHIESPVNEESIWWPNAIALPDGRLLARFNARGDTPYGYGLVMLDRDSNVLWRFSEPAHHDVRFDRDSTIIALVHGWRDTDDDLLADLTLPDRVLEDEIVRLSPEGEVLERLNTVDAYASSEFRWVLSSNFLDQTDIRPWDILHSNTVRVIPESFARHHHFAEAGMYLVSQRSPSLLTIFDPESGEAVWMQRGFWRFQHDPHPLENGHLLLFDNEGHRGPGGRSRVLEFDPGTGALAWQYTGTEEDPLYSQYSSHLFPLPNGNILVTESNAGRIVEITRGGDIVWEFWNPEREVQDGTEYIASVWDGKRYKPEELPFLEREAG